MVSSTDPCWNSYLSEPSRMKHLCCKYLNLSVHPYMFCVAWHQKTVHIALLNTSYHSAFAAGGLVVHGGAMKVVPIAHLGLSLIFLSYANKGYCRCYSERTSCDASVYFLIIRYISAVIKAFAEDQRCEVKTCQFPLCQWLILSCISSGLAKFNWLVFWMSKTIINWVCFCLVL